MGWGRAPGATLGQPRRVLTLMREAVSPSSLPRRREKKCDGSSESGTGPDGAVSLSSPAYIAVAERAERAERIEWVVCWDDAIEMTSRSSTDATERTS